MLKTIAQRHTDLDVNYLARYMEPTGANAMSMAAGSGHSDVVEYLVEEHGKALNVHKGISRFANGPTPLWIAVWIRHRETVLLLLEKAGGPVEYIDEAAKPTADMKRIFLTATQAYRSPVKIRSEERLGRMTQLSSPSERNEDIGGVDEDRNDFQFIAINVGPDDIGWLDRLQHRLSDEDLLAQETDGRAQKERLPHSVSGNEDMTST